MERTPVRNTARLVGVGFLLIAVAGFIPGLTTNLYDGLEFAGDDGTSELLGLFEVSVLHNIVHGLFGVAGLAMAATASGARTFLIGGGAVYLLLAAIQVIGAGDWVPLVGPDLWLHIGLGLGMIGLGVALTRERVIPIT
ncbi:MAG: DUF4383 domain-containing protein [Actinobacteria bacterium]|nr:DUF4383 domain-containing protein [Actinomycetota bacterium]